MREQIEQALKVLVGLPFWGMQRAADMQMFQFGRQHPKTTVRGTMAVVGDYGLHIQCPWRIVGAEGIIVGSHDVYYPAGAPTPNRLILIGDKEGANRRDERIKVFFAGRAERPLVVEGISADAVGGAVFLLNEGHRLELWPHDSLPGEHWRFLQHEGAATRHFVVTGAGIEE